MDFMDTKEERIVEGYEFQSREDAELARQETKKVRYLESHLDYSDPENVLKIYKKAISERIFKTPVGYDYLYKIRQYLISQEGLGEEVPPVALQNTFTLRLRENYTRPQKKVQEAKRKKEKNWLPYSVLLNILLIFAVCAMFAIAKNGKTPNILNYEKAITNQYASWEQELTQRENAVREKEKELNIQ